MYKHHEESIENMKDHFKKQGAVALLLVGSVAKGTERADSDLDGIVILSEEEYAEKQKRNITTETIDGLCTYEGGYFDIKYMTKQYLRDLAELGRNLEISQIISDADRFVDKFMEITSYVPPEDIAVILTRYSKDFQEWWRKMRLISSLCHGFNIFCFFLI